MKLHTPIFVIGLITFITPFLGFSPDLETIIIAAYGIAIMIISATIKSGVTEEIDGADNDFAETETTEEPTYEELTEQVQETLENEEETETEEK